MVEESTQVKAGDTLVYHTKGFIKWGLWTNIGITVFVSMNVLFLTMAIGIPVFIDTILFVLVMYATIRMLSGNTVFTLSRDGIQQEITPNWKSRKIVKKTFYWSDIHSYVRGIDMNRSHQEYGYLHIDVTGEPGMLRISDDKGNKEDFAKLADTFEEWVKELNVSDNSSKKEEKTESSIRENMDDFVGHIEHKPTFYQRPIAKLLTIGFIVLSAFLLNFAITQGMREFNWFRLLIVVIPGTLYMVYRVFYAKK